MTKSERCAEWAGWGLLLAAGAARVAGAWASRAVTDMDTSVVALMARHMAQGRDWPVFFYGQSYMGSLEPAGSALLMKLFGDNGFVLALGPVAFAMVALWALWRWARDASGPWGGVAALLLGAVGPAVYFAFQFAARGGYMVALCVDALVLSGAARLAADWWEGKKGGAWKAGALGLLAGLGLWTDPIVAPALGAAGLALLVGMRGKFWRHWGAAAAGVAGTLAGSAPWWVWCWVRGESMLAMASGTRRTAVKALMVAWQRYLKFQAEGLSPTACTVLALAGVALAAAGTAVWLASARRRGARSNFATLAAVLFVALFVAAFAGSSFSAVRTGRYWVPVWPGVAVLASWACAGWGGGSGRFGRWGGAGRVAAWCAAAALTVAQTALAARIVAAGWKRAPGALAGQAELRDAVAATGADAVMAPRNHYVLNYAWQETVPVSDGMVRFYKPILRAAELAEHPAYFADWKGAEVLFGRMGLEFRRSGNGRVFHDVKPPPQREIAAWRLAADAGEATLELDPPRPVDRVAFWFHGLETLSGVPLRVDVDVLEDGAWRTVHENAALPPMTWSGTRAYFDGGAYQEFPVGAARAAAVRVVPRGMLKNRLERMDVLACGPGEIAEDTAGDGDGAARRVVELAGGDAVVFAPRWLANRIHRGGTLGDDRNRGLSPRVFGTMPPEARSALPSGTPFAAAVERRYAPLVREALAEAGVEAEETADPSGAWSFFRSGGAVLKHPLVWNDRWFSPSAGSPGGAGSGG